MSKKALIVWGGWDGHAPKANADIFERVLKQEGFEVQVSDTVESFNDRGALEALNLIVPCWTAGVLKPEQQAALCGAVASGVGIAGCHGGMCDAFRNSCEYQFMTGGQWVAHPGNDNTKYTVKMGPVKSPITEGIKDFEVSSEQYYMHVDPAIKVLASTHFPVADGPHVGNGPLEMPVLWTKLYGKGKVFYSSLGHTPQVVESEPHLTLMRRGFNWAAK